MENAPVIRSLRPQADRILRNGSAPRAFTAKTSSGPMLINELFTEGTLDTTNLWTTTLGGTGAATVTQNVAGKNYLLLNNPALSDSALLRANATIWFPNTSNNTDANEMYTQIVMEWMALFGTLANQDNTLSIMGWLGQNNSALTRGGNNVAGFILSADRLATLTDAAGTETVNTSTAITETNWNKYKMVMRNGAIDFYVNGTILFTHTANIFTFPLQPIFRSTADAGGASSIQIAYPRLYLLE